MIKRFCNKCKKEIEGFRSYFHLDVTRVDMTGYEEREISSLDLCDDCMEEIKRMAKENEDV